MPIEKLSKALYHIRDFSITHTSGEYMINMNPGHSKACVLCISRRGNISAAELNLTEFDINNLYNGAKIEKDDYTLLGISGHQLAAIAQYRGLKLQPPVYVQAWSIASNSEGKTLYIPDTPEDVDRQQTLVPVYYRVQVNAEGIAIALSDASGYQNGDLMYRIRDHLPIPIPKSGIGVTIPLRNKSEGLTVMPAPHVEDNYRLK